MSFATVKSFLDSWKYESAATAKMLRALTDASLGQRVAPEDRTLGQIGWHLAATIPEMMNRVGLTLPGIEGPPPAKAAAIAEAYERAAAGLAAAVAGTWTDATLAVEDDMYGERWTRGFTAACLVLHQAHHRGQMTVLMRQAGLGVPGVYGPSREEWAALGAPAPEI